VRRTGIELSASRCTVVNAGSPGGQRRRGAGALVRVYNFAILDRADSAQALTAELKLLLKANAFPRRAWVTLWDVRNVHRYMLLPEGRRKEIGAVAHQQAQSILGLDPQDITVALAQGPKPTAERKIELSFFAAASEDIQQRLRPIQDAGFIVEGVSTPCGALWALARLRQPAVPGEVQAYVALGVARSALVIVGNGFLLYARELDWGYAESLVGPPTPRSREDLASQLAAELRRSLLYVKQFWEGDASQLLLCGDMPEIRSLTAPLIERLNIEVETLDTLDGIDVERLPEPAGEFVDQVASMRLALAVAGAPPPLNLLPLEVVATRANRVGRILFTMGTAAAIAFGAFLYEVTAMRTAEVERQVAALQSQVARAQTGSSAARAESAAESSRREALAAFDTQGPRMARILETAANTTPPHVTVRSIRVIAEKSEWRVSVRFVDEAGVENTVDSRVPR
jgi:Tfp pilus assembly PilM family ATPase